MLIQDVVFSITDWSRVAITEYPGTTGSARWRSFEAGNLRVRMVEYSPGYEADHWCERGHVLLVLEGELIAELRGDRRCLLGPGTSFQVSHGEPHLIASHLGAKVFIVD